jgi:hypothetical protein
VEIRARGNGQGHAKDIPRDRDRGQAGTVPPGVPGEDPRLLREIIERQDRQIGDLNTALERSQSLQMAQLTETRELRRRLGELEEENRALRMIEAAPTDTPETPPGAPNRPETSDSAEEGNLRRPVHEHGHVSVR